MRPTYPPVVLSLAEKLGADPGLVVALSLGLTDVLPDPGADAAWTIWKRAEETDLAEPERACLETGAGVWSWLQEMAPDA